MRPRVFIARPLPEKPLTIIQNECEVEIWYEENSPPFAEKTADIDGLVTYGHEPITADLLDNARRLKVIANMGVGYDHIDVVAATKRGIAVGNTPGALNEATADLAFALLLSAARNVVTGDRFIRAGHWRKYDPHILWGAEVHGATLGIIGLGRIGRAVARRARGFEMRILYYQRNRAPGWEEELGLAYTSLEDLLAQSDFVVIMTPLTPQTHHLIGQKELARMKRSAILINTARGPIVDSTALYEALRDGIIAGAGLDVFDPEPIPLDDPLLTLDNVVLCPHLGSASLQTRVKMGMMVAENLLAGLKDQPLPYPINPAVR